MTKDLDGGAAFAEALKSGIFEGSVCKRILPLHGVAVNSNNLDDGATSVIAAGSSAAAKAKAAMPTQTTGMTLSELYASDKSQQISRTNKLVFVHVPKTGGTTIEYSSLFDDARANHPPNPKHPERKVGMIGGHWTIDSLMYDVQSFSFMQRRGGGVRGWTVFGISFSCVAKANQACVHNDLTTPFPSSAVYNGVHTHNGIGRTRRQSADARELTDFTTIGGIRHPCNRFISAFNYLVHKKTTSPADNAWTDTHIGTKTIDEFVTYLQQPRGTHRSSLWDAVKMGVNHFKPMHNQLFYKNGNFGVDIVMCQENLMLGIDRLKAARPDLVIPDTLASMHMKRIENSTLIDRDKRACADLEPETKAAIEKHYRLDYCIFGYTLKPPSHEGAADVFDATSAACGTISRQEYTSRMAKCIAI